MSKSLLSLALALTSLGSVGAAAAQTWQKPIPNHLYDCEYQTPAGVGTSQFVLTPVRPDFLRGTELFTLNGVADQRKVAFAKPVNRPDGSTQWEFTINPVGPQCTNARVYFSGWYLSFDGCSDGHTRICY
jgi:hypothetical protein